VFDTEVIAQTVAFGFRVGEIPVPTRYFAEASSVNLRRSIVYGLSTLAVMARYLLDRWGIRRSPQFRQPLEKVISRYHAAQIFRDGAANSETVKPDH
jgi:hypothetical protein